MIDLRFLFRTPLAEQLCKNSVVRDACDRRLTLALRVYYRLRPWIARPLRRLLQRTQMVKTASNEWLYPSSFYLSLLDAVRTDASTEPLIHPWPDGHRYALVLTHDVEQFHTSADILRIVELEASLGFRSAWNFVPSQGIDAKLIHELKARNCEVGVHGYLHDGLLFQSEREFARRSHLINDTLRAWDVSGFRAPMVHRNLNWMQRLKIRYDSSCFDIDPFQPMPGGVGQIWPFIAGSFVEIPYTMPQDHTLSIILGRRNNRIWQQKAEWLMLRQGMVCLLTHPDYLDSPIRLAMYRDFLAWMRDQPPGWQALPGEVCRWWLDRDESRVLPGKDHAETDDRWVINGPAERRGRLALLEPDASVLHFEHITPEIRSSPELSR